MKALKYVQLLLSVVVFSSCVQPEIPAVGASKSCLDGKLAHLVVESRIRYKSDVVNEGEECLAETQVRVCTNGEMSEYSGSYTHTSCNVRDESKSACVNENLKDSESKSRVRYQTSSVPYGQTCVSETQVSVCNNGTMSSYSGSYTFASCSVNPKGNLACTSENLKDSESKSRIRYKTSSVPYGQSCLSETQLNVCNNGTMSGYSGTYTFSSCVVNPQVKLACTSVNLQDSQTESRTRYKEKSVATGKTCLSEVQTRTCNNGVVSNFTGTYTETSCYVESVAQEIDNNWLDLNSLIVKSDGTRSLGAEHLFNKTRDQGSKIVYFDPDSGDSASAEVYWWDGSNIVDSKGSTKNSNGVAYGTNPLVPNLTAIKPFKHVLGILGNAVGDLRLKSHRFDYNVVAGGYPDWFLFRRGRVHDTFDGSLFGGRSEAEPMVITAYGPIQEGRAKIKPVSKTISYGGSSRTTRSSPFNANVDTDGSELVNGVYQKKTSLHMVLMGLELYNTVGVASSEAAVSPAGGPVTMHIEDCKFVAAGLTYLPKKTTVRRTVLGDQYHASAHNQGYYSAGYESHALFENVIFYRNGYKSNPLTDADPIRDVFSRNIYEGGGAKMGHTYRGIISADGASGGPQMRFGGLIERSLIVEGYWFSATESNKVFNPWLVANGGQSGTSAIVKNNVQFIFRYPNAADPDTNGTSSNIAQTGSGYTLQSASFGSTVEGNIISGAMLEDDLLESTPGSFGLELSTTPETYEDGKVYSLKNNVVKNNIVYKANSGLSVKGNWSAAQGNLVKNNVFASVKSISNTAQNLGAALSKLEISGNKFYTKTTESIVGGIVANDNILNTFKNAASLEHWIDPDRTVKRYVTEAMGLTLLDWDDDQTLDVVQKNIRKSAGQAYDPMGLKTFMAVAMNMRRGGKQATPKSGKPNLYGDYNWNEDFTGPAVVNWIREGFGLEELP